MSIPAQESQHPHILIADDDQGIALLLREFVRQLGGRQTVVQDGIEAIKVLLDDPADLVMTDYHMPRMDGIEVLRTIKGHPRRRQIPVIVISGMRESLRRELQDCAWPRMRTSTNLSMGAPWPPKRANCSCDPNSPSRNDSPPMPPGIFTTASASLPDSAFSTSLAREAWRRFTRRCRCPSSG